MTPTEAAIELAEIADEIEGLPTTKRLYMTTLVGRLREVATALSEQPGMRGSGAVRRGRDPVEEFRE